MSTWRTLVHFTHPGNNTVVARFPGCAYNNRFPIDIKTIPEHIRSHIHHDKRLHVKANLNAETPYELVQSLHDWEST